MADISIQFHALPDEVVYFAEEIVRDFSLYLAGMRSFPFDVKQVCDLPCRVPGSVVEFCKTMPEYKRLAFTLARPVVTVKSELDFADKNPDYLRLDVGKLVAKGLEQSWLSARTDSKEAIEIWKKVAARLRKVTKQGVLAINPKTGATSIIKSFRYTPKAKALESQGIAALPFAGTALLKLE
jgi:hypothetical protein